MNPDILQYRTELLTACPKNRKAKRMLCKEFDLSLQPLLEDIPSPTYQDLMDAFGSPSHMAETLLDSIHIPPPLFQVPVNGSTALLVQDANYSEHTVLSRIMRKNICRLG